MDHSEISSRAWLLKLRIIRLNPSAPHLWGLYVLHAYRHSDKHIQTRSVALGRIIGMQSSNSNDCLVHYHCRSNHKTLPKREGEQRGPWFSLEFQRFLDNQATPKNKGAHCHLNIYIYMYVSGQKVSRRFGEKERPRGREKSVENVHFH